MDVSNVTASAVNAIANNLQQPAPANEKQQEKLPEVQQDSTVVKLSELARQMNRAENQNAERTETRPQEAAEPPGIRFMEGENIGGSVNTFA